MAAIRAASAVTIWANRQEKRGVPYRGVPWAALINSHPVLREARKYVKTHAANHKNIMKTQIKCLVNPSSLIQYNWSSLPDRCGVSVRSTQNMPERRSGADQKRNWAIGKLRQSQDQRISYGRDMGRSLSRPISN